MLLAGGSFGDSPRFEFHKVARSVPLEDTFELSMQPADYYSSCDGRVLADGLKLFDIKTQRR